MKDYCIHYKMFQYDDEKCVFVLARNKFEAYDKAVYEVIPEKEETHPYSAWVVSVTYNNGSYKRFATFEGKRF